MSLIPQVKQKNSPISQVKQIKISQKNWSYFSRKPTK